MKVRIFSATLLLFAILAAPRPSTAQQPEESQAQPQQQDLQPTTAPTAELITTIHPSYFSSYSNPLTRTPSLLLRFNAALDLETVTENIYFVGNTGQRITVSATRPTLEQTSPLQNSNLASPFPP